MDYQENKGTDVTMHALDILQILRSKLHIIILSTIILVIISFVYTTMQTEQYVSMTRFQLVLPEREISIYKGTVAGRSGMRNFLDMNTQLEILRSKKNLLKTVDELKLDEKWRTTREGAQGILRHKIKLRPVKQTTNLVDLYVYHNDPNLAAEIATSVRDQFEQLSNDESQERAYSAVRELEKQIERQKELVENKRNELNKITKNMKVIETKNRWRTQNNVERAEDELFISKRKLKQIETQIDSINNLSGDELLKAVSVINIPENIVKSRYPEYLNYKLNEQRYRDANLGRNHPKMRELLGQKYELKKLLDMGVQQIRKNLILQKDMFVEQLRTMEEYKGEIVEKEIAEEISKGKRDEIAESFEGVRKVLNDLNTRLNAEKSMINISKVPFKVLEEAKANFIPISPNPKRNVLIGLAAGLFFGVALAFILEYMDTSIKTVDDVEKYLQLPVIAVIPKGVPLLHKQPGLCPDEEAYRILRTNIEFNRKTADSNAITVISGGAGEGKSTTLTNLAYVCAQGGYTTLMLDADLRRPKLHTFFDVSNSIGLSNYLTSKMDIENAILQTPVDNLYFMPSGVLPSDATAVLNLQKMSELIKLVKSKFDLVLIDSPPILGVSDASVLVSEVDLTMLVIQHRKLPRKITERVKQSVESVGGNLLGVVLNNVDVSTDSQYQYYTSYYTYYSSASNYVENDNSNQSESTVSNVTKNNDDEY